MGDFKEMRRKRQQLPEEETINLLRQATSGVLSVLDEAGYPYGVPLSYVYNDNKLYFHSAQSGHKIDAIRHSDKASFTIICKDEIHPETFTTFFRSVICIGRVRIIEDTAEKQAAFHMFGERYCPNDEQALDATIKRSIDRAAVIEFTIEHVTGKEAIELTKERNSMEKAE